MAKNLLNFMSKSMGKVKAKLSPTVPTNNPSPGLSVSKLNGQGVKPSTPLGNRKASMSPSQNASRQVKRKMNAGLAKWLADKKAKNTVQVKKTPTKGTKKKGYNFAAVEKKLGVIQS